MPLIMPDASRAVVSDLRRLIGADLVKDDGPTKTAYAVDASIYRITPQAVVLVESEDHIQTLVSYARTRGIPITARAAGTNLTVSTEDAAPTFAGDTVYSATIPSQAR